MVLFIFRLVWTDIFTHFNSFYQLRAESTDFTAAKRTKSLSLSCENIIPGHFEIKAAIFLDVFVLPSFLVFSCHQGRFCVGRKHRVLHLLHNILVFFLIRFEVLKVRMADRLLSSYSLLRICPEHFFEQVHNFRIYPVVFCTVEIVAASSVLG